MNVDELVRDLRHRRDDSARVEAKSATGGFPDNVATTLSAFANTPGGGDIVFGLAESRGFAAVGVYDAGLCQKAVTNLARHGVVPALAITTEAVDWEGATLVLVHVPEAERTLKPVRVRKSGLAYLRQYDGDYPISEQEEQAFIANRGQPVNDEQPVPRATPDDLEMTAVTQYLAERRLVSPRLARMTDDEVLLRTGVIADGHPTLAGLLALGTYPQQFFANLGIQASFVPSQAGPGLRVADSASFTGPIPVMLEEAVSWVYTTTGRAITADQATGAVTNQPTYPLVAVRELVANALIHRDLGPWALNQPVTLRITPTELMIANPGGLFGLRVESLGLTPSHLRNGRLAEMCQYVTTRDQARVVERLGSGIPAVRESLRTAGRPDPRFLDQGVRFVATLKAAPSPGPVKVLGDPQAAVLSALADGPRTAREIRVGTGLTARQVAYALKQLVNHGNAASYPLDGRTNTYSLGRG
ncbi:MAG: putative DNA binding domain-containing protein [Propionibacteriaceae bacterium]|jgi:ATP-dependent DNA helicase RecG|nr:putative DNA binding domain-containing protein [Propionibacteriaceae bacterium]